MDDIYQKTLERRKSEFGGDSVTPDQIEELIVEELYFTAADGIAGSDQHHRAGGAWAVLNTITICVLILKNGFKIIGVNAGAADPVLHQPELGKQYARKAATDQLWPLLGYELKQRLYETRRHT